MPPEAQHDNPTPPRPRPADIRHAVAAAVVTGGSTAELEGLVRSYVRALKEAGAAPEQALARVKAVVRVQAVMPIPGRPVRPADRLADDVVAWFVAEYYRAD
jgi:hypothetical protein